MLGKQVLWSLVDEVASFDGGGMKTEYEREREDMGDFSPATYGKS